MPSRQYLTLGSPSCSSRQSSSLTNSQRSSPSSEPDGYFTGIWTPFTERSGSFSKELVDDFVLVVGGLGYIGSHTCWELLQAGRNVIIIDNLSNSTSDVLDKLIRLRDVRYKGQATSPIIDFYEVDYRQKERLREILACYEEFPAAYVRSPSPLKSRITCVIHFAAYKAVAESFHKPLEYYANNVSGMVDFCALLSEFKIKTFVFSSSATVYGDLANRGGRLTEEQCDSTSCTGLTNPYGRSKWMCEAILSDLAYSDPAWTIIALRYFNPIGCDETGILGEEPRSTPNNLMPIVIKAMTGQLPVLDIFGTDWDTPDGSAIRDFIHVSDLARGHLAALVATEDRNFKKGFHIYNLGTGTGHSVKEIIRAMEEVSGRKIPIHETPRRDGDVGICIADPSRSARQLNWKTERSLKRACWDICRYIGYLRDVDTATERPICCC